METQADILDNLLADLDLPRVPQQARSRQKRDAILAAAAHLFEQRGYETTTADDIAMQAGVSVGTFYAYFRNKRQVFLTLYAACIESLLALNLTEINFGADPLQAIRETVHKALERDDLSIGLQRALAELLPRDPEIAAYEDRVRRILYQQIAAIIRRVDAQGLAWPELDIEPTAWAITLLLDQLWQVEMSATRSTTEIVRQRDAVAYLIYHAIFGCP